MLAAYGFNRHPTQPSTVAKHLFFHNAYIVPVGEDCRDLPRHGAIVRILSPYYHQKAS
jgi:hypothetical protein